MQSFLNLKYRYILISTVLRDKTKDDELINIPNYRPFYRLILLVEKFSTLLVLNQPIKIIFLTIFKSHRTHSQKPSYDKCPILIFCSILQSMRWTNCKQRIVNWWQYPVQQNVGLERENSKERGDNGLLITLLPKVLKK